MNVTEYLEHLFAQRHQRERPARRSSRSSRTGSGTGSSPGDGPERLAAGRSSSCRREDDRFHMEGGSWTNNISWVRGYDDRARARWSRPARCSTRRCSRRGVPTERPALPQRPVPPARRARPVATATGARASGPTTAPSSPAARPRSCATTCDDRTPWPASTSRWSSTCTSPPATSSDLLDTHEWEAREILWAIDRIPRSLWAVRGRRHASTCRCPGTLLETLARPALPALASTASSTAGRCCGTCRTPRSSRSWAPATTIPSCR